MAVNKRRHVVMLLENNPYPDDSRVRQEALALTGAGYRVTVICPLKPGQEKRQQLGGVSVRRFRLLRLGGGQLKYPIEYLSALVTMLVHTITIYFREGFDILHMHNPPDILAFIGLLARVLGKQVVFDQHDLAPEMYQVRFARHRQLIYKALCLSERLAYRVANITLATNATQRNVQLMRGGIPPERSFVVRNGPDLDRLNPVPVDRQLKPPEQVLVGYVGVMGPQDGVDCLLRAMDVLVHSMGEDQVRCLLIGDGDARPQLAELVRELGLDDYVTFVGWVSDSQELSRYLSSMDICVEPAPSNVYNDTCTMIKVMEYMCFAKPVVVFDLPEHRCSAGEAALYALPNDPVDLAEKIAMLIRDTARRQEMGRIGRERILKVLAWQHQVPNLLAAYRYLERSKARRK